MPKRNLILLFLATTICLLAWMARDRSGHGRRFAEVMSAIENSYLDPIDQRGLFAAAMEGVFSRLDEHSAFVVGDDQEDLESLLDQEFGGVGLQLAIDPRNGRLSVITPVVGSPAWRAGLAPGDLVEAIDGVATAGMPLREVVGRLRGPPGTAVVIAVAAAGASTSDPAIGRDREAESIREISLVREAVKMESVLGDRRLPDGSWDWFLEGTRSIALIRITSFGEHTVEDLEAAVASIGADRRPEGVVLDLRGNPGGLLSAAVQVCDLFLDEGTIVSTVGRSAKTHHRGAAAGSDATDVRPATPGAAFAGVPMAVLVDGLTASAGEIVAACLQDNGRAVVVGSRSFGKGTVQSILPLTDGDGLVKLTTAEYLRPSGATIHRRPLDADDATWGVSPDSGCEMSPTRETLEAVRHWRRRRDAAPRDVEQVGAGSSASLPAAVDPVIARAIDVLTSGDGPSSGRLPSGQVELPADFGGEKKAARHADEAPRPRQ